VYAIVSVIGGVIWADGVLLIGHALGHVSFVRDHASYIDYAIIAVVILSFVPALFHFLQNRRRGRAKNESDAVQNES
jgi:membrane-associated protein